MTKEKIIEQIIKIINKYSTSYWKPSDVELSVITLKTIRTILNLDDLDEISILIDIECLFHICLEFEKVKQLIFFEDYVLYVKNEIEKRY